MAQERRLKYIEINRNQMAFLDMDLEALIPEDHIARIIWQVVGSMNLTKFEADTKTIEGEGGRPAWPPQLLISIWIYSYTLGIASAREIERRMQWEPGLRWLSAAEGINHHTLSSFRVEHGEAVNDLFAQQLALLEGEGLLDWSIVMHDGTKIQAKASRWSYRRQEHLDKRIEVAREAMRVLDRQPAEAGANPEGKSRKQAAQQRAARERVERIEAAMEALQQRQLAAKPSEREEVRVSISESEARKMKDPDGGWNLSYNVQTTTSATGNFLVGITATQSQADSDELENAIDRVQQKGKPVQQLVTDGGYVSRENVAAMVDKGVELIAPPKSDASREAGALKRAGIERAYGSSQFKILEPEKALECPQGKRLERAGTCRHHGIEQTVYQARAEDCAACPARKDCCGKRGTPRRIERPIETQAIKDLVARMEDPARKALYRRRKEVAEWPHLWIKSLKGLRRFSVFGQAKAGLELIWIAFAYNLDQMIRVKADSSKPIAA